MLQHMQLSFPAATLDAGEGKTVEMKLDRVFRAQRLVLIGFMSEIRGHFKIRHTRLPLLNRENVIAYSNLKSGRTTVEYREHSKGNFVRSYLPVNVKYVHTDPLSYVTLEQLNCDKIPALYCGVTAELFQSEALGNGTPLPSSSASISLSFKNRGDIQVRVFAALFGVEYVDGATRDGDRRRETA